jgi:hypothetical protein
MKVVNCKREKYDVLIDSTTKWGNPFVMTCEADRAEVIRKYEQWILTQPELMSSLHELYGKTLGCWCAPKACHGEILLRLANQDPYLQTR